MKKVIKAIFVTFLVLILSLNCSFAFASEPEVTVYVDGTQIQFDVCPIIENGRTLVPMRYIFEALDAKVEWIDEENTAVATKDGNEIKVIIGSNYLWKNGSAIELDVPAKLVDDRTLVPVRAVSEGLGAKVDWDEELFRVIITSVDKNEQEKLFEKVTSPNQSGEFNISQLSIYDFEFLKSIYGEARYMFEQNVLPNALFAEGANIHNVINYKYEGNLETYANIWNIFMSNIISQIQEESEEVYDFGYVRVDEESIVRMHMDILKCAKMSSDDLYKVSYQTTPKGYNMLLTTFNNVITNDSTIITSKYIAVVSTLSGIRYFTLEYSPMAREMDINAEVYFLCEIHPDGRNNYGNIPCTLNDFLNGIDNVIGK